MDCDLADFVTRQLAFYKAPATRKSEAMPKERRKRRREEAPMPLAGAGLVRFFEEEVKGLQVPPEAVLLGALGLIVTVLVAHIFLGIP